MLGLLAQVSFAPLIHRILQRRCWQYLSRFWLLVTLKAHGETVVQKIKNFVLDRRYYIFEHCFPQLAKVSTGIPSCLWVSSLKSPQKAESWCPRNGKLSTSTKVLASAGTFNSVSLPTDAANLFEYFQHFLFVQFLLTIILFQPFLLRDLCWLLKNSSVYIKAPKIILWFVVVCSHMH